MDDLRERAGDPPARRLPHPPLPSAPSGAPVALVAPGGRRVPILVGVHGAECGACRAFVRRLAHADAELRAWDARVLLLVPGGVDDAARFAADAEAPFPVLADEARAVGARVEAEGAFAVVADPWGEVRHRHVAGAAHDLPEPAELVEWARFVAIQCPECEGEAW